MSKKNEIATVETTAVTTGGFDTSEVMDGIELKKNKLGRFVGKEVEGLSFEEIDAVIVGGKFNYIFWADKDKEPDGQAKLYFDVDTKEKAEEQFSQLCISDGLAEKGYKFASDVDERYIIMFMDVKTGAPFFLNMSKSGKKEFLNYWKTIQYGLQGNKNKEMSKVVTKIATQEMSSGSFSWITEKFTFVKDVK